MKTIDNDYKLIPMNEITDEARKIAVSWGDNMRDDFISQKHKLASDIMNYARRYHESEVKKLSKANVIKSVCDCKNPSWWSGNDGLDYCLECSRHRS